MNEKQQIDNTDLDGDRGKLLRLDLVGHPLHMIGGLTLYGLRVALSLQEYK